MEISLLPVHVFYVDPDPIKLAEEIEASRQEIAKLQDRVKQLVARRGKRAELVKPHLPTSEVPAHPAKITSSGARAAVHEDDPGKELSLEEGLAALNHVP